MNDNEERKQEEKEVGFYEKLASRTAELTGNGKKTLDEALKKAKEEILGTGDVSRSQADKLASFLRRDLSSLSKSAQKTKDTLKRAVDPKRVSVGAQSVFVQILRSVAGKLEEVADKSEKSLEYKTGEVTSPGTLSCKECGAEMNLTSTVRIPPCPKCHKTVFRKSY